MRTAPVPWLRQEAGWIVEVDVCLAALGELAGFHEISELPASGILHFGIVLCPHYQENDEVQLL